MDCSAISDTHYQYPIDNNASEQKENMTISTTYQDIDQWKGLNNRIPQYFQDNTTYQIQKYPRLTTT